MYLVRNLPLHPSGLLLVSDYLNCDQEANWQDTNVVSKINHFLQ